MKRKLMIENFGKIKKAEIEISPLTLFVGDNNSGKSYLLSLIWAIYAANGESVIFSNLMELLEEDYKQIYEDVRSLILKTAEGYQNEIKLPSKTCVEILNAMLERNKDKFVAEIFNSQQIKIGRLSVTAGQEFEVTIKGKKTESGIIVSCKEGSFGMIFRNRHIEEDLGYAVKRVLSEVLLWLFEGSTEFHSQNTVYLPAARTGFMLAKNVINKVGRQVAYDVSGFQDREEIPPFTKPIIHFLDMLEGLSLEHKTEYGEVVEWMENAMTHGRIQYGKELNGQEIRYLPKGSEESLPLRTTSAVVTELTPLLLLLKYRLYLRGICYEEPEMCLHPRLQQEMGRLLIRLVNRGLSVIATTHSDIIVQHINNMCRMKEMDSPKNLMERLDLSENDVIDLQKIAIYQFTDMGEYSTVEKVEPKDGEFQVETFSNALMDILEQTSEVQDFEVK